MRFRYALRRDRRLDRGIAPWRLRRSIIVTPSQVKRSRSTERTSEPSCSAWLFFRSSRFDRAGAAPDDRVRPGAGGGHRAEARRARGRLVKMREGFEFVVAIDSHGGGFLYTSAAFLAALRANRWQAGRACTVARSAPAEAKRRRAGRRLF